MIVQCHHQLTDWIKYCTTETNKLQIVTHHYYYNNNNDNRFTVLCPGLPG